MNDWPWPAPQDDGAADHLVAGLQLPAIALASSAGVPIDVSVVTGGIALFIYPFTGTPGEPNPPLWDEIPGAHGSTPEAEGFRDAMPLFAIKGIKVIGLSSQPTQEQQAFARRASLTFPLLSDVELKFAQALRLPRFETGGKIYLRRLTLLLRDGRIEKVIYPVHPPHTHAQDLLKLLD